MQETNTILFFRELASRMYKENDLSDVIYALCESNLQFKQFFLDYFFDSLHLSATDTSIQREVQYTDGSRPDFVIQSKGRIFFVEVKIWDGSHHFDQYAKTLVKEGMDVSESLAYITNYKVVPEALSKSDRVVYEQVKVKVKEWKDFRDELERLGRDPVARSWATGEDVQGFIEYCKRVCPATVIEVVDNFTFNKGDFHDVKRFYENLGKVLTGLQLELNDGSKQISRVVKIDRYLRGKYNSPGDWIGSYFSIANLLRAEETIWGWVGCYLKEESSTPGLCIEFLNKNGWGAPVFKKFCPSRYQIDYCYEIRDTNEDTILAKVRDALQNVINGKLPQQAFSFKTLEPLRNMRKFSLFLEQQILNDLNVGDDARIEIVQASDSQNPSGWCGVYFDVITELKSVNGDNELVVHETCRNRGWLGVYFDGKKRLEDCEGEDGSRIVLEWNGTTQLVADASNTTKLNPREIREAVIEGIHRIAPLT